MKSEVSTLRPPILRDGWKESFRPDKGEASLVGKSEGGGGIVWEEGPVRGKP